MVDESDFILGHVDIDIEPMTDDELADLDRSIPKDYPLRDMLLGIFRRPATRLIIVSNFDDDD